MQWIPNHLCMTHARHCRQRGFTLIELVLVLILMAVLAGIVVPQVLGRYRGSSLESLAVLLEEEVIRCRTQSMLRGKPLRMQVDSLSQQTVVEVLKDRVWQPFEDDGLKSSWAFAGRLEDLEMVFVPQQQANSSAGKLENDIAFEAIFFPDGSCTRQGELRLSMEKGEIRASEIIHFPGGSRCPSRMRVASGGVQW